jgi:solute carrier family 25 phosphate transporter 23/24/25/41
MGNVLNKADPAKDEVIKLFLEIYTLPKFSEYIKSTPPDSEERTQKITELQQLIKDTYFKLNLEPPVKEYIDAIKYNKQVNILKSHLLDKILQEYKNIPTFIVINEINNKIKSNDPSLCEQLMLDLAAKIKEETMKKEAKEQMKLLFKKYDINGDGTISIEELEDATNRLGLPGQVAKEVLVAADKGNDGKISFEEFEAYTEEHVLKYYKIFYNLDSDNDMRLSYKQARQSLHEVYPKLEMSDEIYKKLFLAMDEDKSGLISFDEWCQFLLLFPEKNLKYVTDLWRLIAVTTILPQEPDVIIIDKNLKNKKGESITLDGVLKNFICGGIAGGISRTITAPLENLKVLYQTSYIETKPPTLLKGFMQIYENRGLLGLYRGNSVSIVMSILEQAMRFAIIDYTKKHLEDDDGHVSPKQLLYIGIFTGIFSTSILFPLEVVRVRVISSDEIQHKVYRKFLKIYNQHGLPGFYTGLVPHLMCVLPAGSVNVVFYNILKKMFVTEKDIENLNINKFMLIGGGAAAITGTVTYPFNIITTRTIVTNRDRPITDRISFISIMRKTRIDEGWMGFFKGYRASLLRLFIGQSFNFGTFETIRGYIRLRDRNKIKKKN